MATTEQTPNELTIELARRVRAVLAAISPSMQTTTFERAMADLDATLEKLTRAASAQHGAAPTAPGK